MADRADYARAMAQLEARALDPVTVRATRPGVRAVLLGRAVFAATSVACAVAVALDLHTGTHATLAYVGATEVLALTALLLTTRMPAHRMSWVLAATALLWGIANLAFAYAVEALVADPGRLPGGTAAAWFDNWAWLPGLALFLCGLLLLMPDGRLASSRWRPVAGTVAAGTVIASAAVSVGPTFELSGTEIANPLAADGAAVVAAAVLGALLILAGLAGSVAAFVVRYRRSAGESRQQLRWVGLSFAVAVPLVVVGAATWGVVPGTSVLPALGLVAVPAGIAVAVLRYRLYELDLVVNRALVYGVLTVAVAGGYVLAVGLAGSYLSRRGDVLFSLLVTGAVALGFQPLRERVQRSVNRLTYGARDDPYRAAAALSRSLAGADAVLPTAVETIGRALALGYVALVVDADDDDEHTVAVYGTPVDGALAFPLVHQGATVGELRLAPRPGERLRERDHRLIADLAPQVAAAVHAAGLAQELQAARRLLVELREEERRRIRRDLHDGLGPALAGLTFTLDAVRNLADSDRRRADELLAAATDQVQALIADVRRLIYGLRPPALDELGLVGAVRSLASREAPLAIRVDVRAPDPMPPLPAAVEVAAYRIVQEALTNVTRHARARRCDVRLALEPTALSLEVRDDGVGIADGGRGVGLRAMAERAAELGGTCGITSRPGAGTSVSARLPLEPEDGAAA